MDIQLPEVLARELEVTEWLKEDPELKAVPIENVAAFAMKGDEERIRQGGCEAYFVQTDLGRQVHRHYPALSRIGLRAVV